MRPLYYRWDRETGAVEPCGLDGYFAMMEGPRLTPDGRDHVRRLARWTDGETVVSTVFLAIDHALGDGPPVLWETMAFGGPLDGEQVRYETQAEAEAGHAEMVRRVEMVRKGGKG